MVDCLRVWNPVNQNGENNKRTRARQHTGPDVNRRNPAVSTDSSHLGMSSVGLDICGRECAFRFSAQSYLRLF